MADRASAASRRDCRAPSEKQRTHADAGGRGVVYSGAGRGDIPIASEVELLPLPVLLDALEHGAVRDARGLQQQHEVVLAEVAVRAAVGLAGPRRVLGQNLQTSRY